MSDEMTNSLEDLLEQHDYDMPQVGDIREGVIVASMPQGLIIDLGLKRDGLVPVSDLNKLEPDERDALKPNDEIFVYVLQTDDPEALIVSIHLARLNQDWIAAEAVMESGDLVEGEVIGYNKGGLIVPFGRIRGFVPISHLSDISSGMGERRRQQRLARLRGETIAVKIIEVDRRRHRLVMSQREARREWEEIKRAELMETLNVGETRTGRVSGIRDFGAFVDLGGADGLVHISELTWHRIDHPREVVRIGDEIEVSVLAVDRESGRISLSRKKLLPNPWDTVSERYDQNELVEGKITRIVDYGAFAEIEPGVEGLLHISQLSRSPVEDPRSMISEGEVHLLRIVSIDQRRQRIGLSLKAVTATEQIEWMAQKELAEALRREEEEAAENARSRRRAEEGAEAETAEAGEMADSATVDAADGEVEEAAADEVEVVEADESVDAASDAAPDVESSEALPDGDAVDADAEPRDADEAVAEMVVSADGDSAAEAGEEVVESGEEIVESVDQTIEEAGADAVIVVAETGADDEGAAEVNVALVEDDVEDEADEAEVAEDETAEVTDEEELATEVEPLVEDDEDAEADDAAGEEETAEEADEEESAADEEE